jgi:hypothetical protein
VVAQSHRDRLDFDAPRRADIVIDGAEMELLSC